MMLDNREIAALIWLGLAAAAALSNRSLRQGLGSVFRSLLRLAILLPLVVMVGYVCLEVWIGASLSVWHNDLMKGTLIWTGGSALVLFFNCTKIAESPGFFRETVAGTIGVLVFVEFFMNLFVMSLWLELVLQPVLVGLALLSAVGGLKAENQPVKRLVDGILALVTLLLLAYTGRELYENWGELDEKSLLLQFALPIWLTIGLMPFIYSLSLYIGYDSAFRGINWVTAEPSARWRARFALATSFTLPRARTAWFQLELGEETLGSSHS